MGVYLLATLGSHNLHIISTCQSVEVTFLGLCYYYCYRNGQFLGIKAFLFFYLLFEVCFVCLFAFYLFKFFLEAWEGGGTVRGRMEEDKSLFFFFQIIYNLTSHNK